MRKIIKGLFHHPPHPEKHRAVLNMQMKRGGGKTRCSWCPTTTSLHLQQDCTFIHNINGSAAVTYYQGGFLLPEKLLHLQAFSTAKELLRQKKKRRYLFCGAKSPRMWRSGAKAASLPPAVSVERQIEHRAGWCKSEMAPKVWARDPAHVSPSHRSSIQ